VPTGAPNLGGSSSGSVLGNLADKASSLLPSSTAGKLALGAGALALLNSGGAKPQATPPSTPPGQDPSFNQHLQQLNFNYDPVSQATNPLNLANYGVSRSQYDPKLGRFVDPTDTLPDQQVGEYNFFNNPSLNANQSGPAYTKAAGGGMIPDGRDYYGSPTAMAMGGLAQYAAGGMPDVPTDHGYLQGPGDGVSDDIPATIGGSQPARLAGGEFVLPARIVSEIGNGSSDAGASRLHNMMMRIDAKRRKGDYARDSKAYQELPA